MAIGADAGRKDPITILRAADATRQPHLLPLRYGRMLQTPFTFYRVSAGVMAADLGPHPGDGDPRPGINDLDETMPAPWEWDVKRLVASFVLAARSNQLSDANGCDAAIACARSYRSTMREFTEMDRNGRAGDLVR